MIPNQVVAQVIFQEYLLTHRLRFYTEPEIWQSHRILWTQWLKLRLKPLCQFHASCIFDNTSCDFIQVNPDIISDVGSKPLDSDGDKTMLLAQDKVENVSINT